MRLLTLALALTLPALATAQISFAPAIPCPAVVGTPRGPVALDFDGDLDLDVVLVSQPSGELVVLLNDGLGNLSPGPTAPTGSGPRAVTALDFDADGDLDFAVANGGSADMTLLTRQGAAFATTTIPLTAFPRAVASGDVDGDQDPDLVVATDSGGTLHVVFNVSGVPVVGPALFIGGGPRSVQLGDVDLDGDLDVALALGSFGQVVIAANDGAGTFGNAVSYITGPIAGDAEFGDFDADGDLDVIAVHFLAPTAALLVNQGNGVFASASTFSVGVHMRDVVVADFDFDGTLDLAAGDIATNSIALYAGAAAAFSAVGSLTVAGAPDSLTAADLNGDFLPDLVIAEATTATVSVALSTAPVGPVLGGPAAGRLGADFGGPFDVLMIDASSGGPDRRVELNRFAPFVISMAQPPHTTLSLPFAIFGRIGAPTASDSMILPAGIGISSIVPAPLSPADPALFMLTNNIVPDPTQLLGSYPTPWIDTLVTPNFAVDFVLQAIVIDLVPVVANALLVRVL